MPHGLCAITLLTNGGYQSLHHLCEDVSVNGSNEAKQYLVEASIAFEKLRIGEFVFENLVRLW